MDKHRFNTMFFNLADRDKPTIVEEKMECVLCKKEIAKQIMGENGGFWTGGHNPWPLATEGRACHDCNEKVVYARLKQAVLHR